MSLLPVELAPYLKYAAPPLVGAFIGYLTNRVAIRMLFRPLKEWRVFGLRVPMTPGVIPSKRAQLADNMGEVVGDHLLTSTEIGNALKEDKFQQHLLNVISERVGDILHRDLGSIAELVPQKFSIYFDLGLRTVKHQLKENVHEFIDSDDFEEQIGQAIENKFEHILDRQVGDMLNSGQRDFVYGFLEESLQRMLASPVMEEWVNEFVRQKVYETLQQEKCLSEVLPETLLELIETSIRQQTPNILKKLAEILKDEQVRTNIVQGACGGVESFITSLGPMSAMVQNFISMETVEVKIREYLDEKEEDIQNWLGSEELQEKVGAILSERFAHFCTTPLVKLINTADADKVDTFCATASAQISALLREKEVSVALSAMIKNNVETHLDDGNVRIRTLLFDFFGPTGSVTAKNWAKKECVSLLRSADTKKTLDALLESLVDTVVHKKIGKISNVLPGDVRKEIYLSIQKMASSMLEKEVPGLVDSLDIRQIVADKLNSLDLLRLERLLLSIMEEQFKYINLFGALLGFILGCLNLVFLHLT
ncbi:MULTISPECIES: DUF445 family protein [Desulfosediminicola]|uniref:DUF445 family protein n=1 Tax=Desulfosediminicola TaxID=2886823 RepID=UPI0010AB77BC|nr:DUF445 family protein [Desulfosediminicola ganghwensis]